MGSSYRTRAQWNGSSPPSGVYWRPSITTAPERPSTVGFALPSGALQYLASEASGAAVLHAEHDAESQVIWARGALGEWLVTSYVRFLNDALSLVALWRRRSVR